MLGQTGGQRLEVGKEKAFPKRTSVLEWVNEVLMHTVTFFSKICFKFPWCRLKIQRTRKEE